MKQMPIQTKKLTLDKTTISLLGSTRFKGYRAMDGSGLPLDLSTLPACNTTATTTGGLGTGIAFY